MTQDVNEDQDTSSWTEIDIDNLGDLDDISIEIEEQEIEEDTEVSIDDSDELISEEDENEEIAVEDEEDEESDEEEADEEEAVEDEEPVETKKNSRYQERVRKLANEKNQALLDAEELRKENALLRQEQREAELRNTQAQKINAKRDIDSASAEIQEAMSNDDAAAMVEAQKALSKAQVEQMALEAYEANLPEVEQEEPVQQQQVSYEREEVIDHYLPEGLARDWAYEQDWFITNPTLTQKTLEIATALEAEGLSIDDPDFFEALEEDLAKAFPRKFKTPLEEAQPSKSKKSKSSPKMGSGSNRPTVGSKRKVVKLTAFEKELADDFGISHKEYALQKLAKEQAGDEWTDIHV